MCIPVKITEPWDFEAVLTSGVSREKEQSSSPLLISGFLKTLPSFGPNQHQQKLCQTFSTALSLIPIDFCRPEAPKVFYLRDKRKIVESHLVIAVRHDFVNAGKEVPV